MSSTEQKPPFQDFAFSRAVFEAEHNGEEWAIRELADLMADVSAEDRMALIRRWAASARECRAARHHEPTPQAKVYKARRVLKGWSAAAGPFLTDEMACGLLENAVDLMRDQRWCAVRLSSPRIEEAGVSPSGERELVLELTVDPVV